VIENTHPFVRVFDRRHLVFAHNGTLPNVRDIRLEYESAIGETDSEHAFCVILETLRKRHGSQYPKDPLVLGEFLYEMGNELGADGVFNFLLADGEHLFARCGDHLSAVVRRSPFGQATLVDADLTVNIDDEVQTVPDGQMAVIATFPLTRDEQWEEAAPGTLWVFRSGDLVASFSKG
jgi:predicted glutamine amidotransferase